MKAPVAMKCLLFLVLLTAVAGAQVRNGALGTRGALPPYFTQETVVKLRADGWTCPDVDEWPHWWGGQGGKVTIEWPREGGRAGGYGRISGVGGYVTGYHGLELKGDQVLTVWARGKGTLTAGFLGYTRTDTGEIRGGAASPPAMAVTVNSERWMRYRHLLRPAATPGLYNVHVTMAAAAGVVDFDEVDLRPATPAEALLVEAEGQLRAEGGLLTDADVVATDAAFRDRVGLYHKAAVEFEQVAAPIDAPLRESLRESVKALDPYVLGDGKTAVHATQYNEMLTLTHALKTLAGQPAVAASAPAVAAVAATPTIKHLPGVRAARPDTLTITDIRSNKVRYDENEAASTKATLVNTSDHVIAGTLVAVMVLDVDNPREITRAAFTVPAGATRTWDFRYSVGPETYGRAIEVRFVAADGQVVDSWQEYFGVAAEWFRIQQATYNATMKSYSVDPWTTYFNQGHQFAAEPTDWGVQTEACAGLDKYISGQPLYRLSMPPRRAAYAHWRGLGNMGTFYQNMHYNGQMGYEVIRQHPEFSLYDPSGQFAVDPVYGGSPNPFELASPIETGPKREVKKPYLDRQLTSWQHGPVDFTREDVVRYMAECIRKHAEFLNCDGVYVDGNVGVWAGYTHEGKPNVPGGKAEDYVELNARNHNLFSQILKEGNPNFGTWYNWAYRYTRYFIGLGLGSPYLGSGTGLPGDPGDKNVRAATGWKNVMFLDEIAGALVDGEGVWRHPEGHLENMCDNRDYLVQTYGANVIIGYIANYVGIEQDVPGPDRWGWATHNYCGAQLIATQHHFVSWFLPGWRPTIQFMTRYSSLIWAPDIKIVPETEKLLTVTGTDQVWWKRLVYRRDTAQGYDLIVHLVRIPPYEKWDLKWLDEPKPLESVRITVNAGPGRLRDVQAMRPYYFDEPQQPVQRKVEATVNDGRVEITVPEFRYHTMVVFRFAK